MSRKLLLKAVDDFKCFFDTVNKNDQDLLLLRDEFNKEIKSIICVPDKLRQENPLVASAQTLQGNIINLIKQNTQAWEKSQPMRELSEQFEDKVIFLVFGKVNAGKSTFCNFIASLFSDKEKRYFKIEGGELVDSAAEFKEGVVETTAAIQGVELAGNLILLDSPGLHSVTEENGDMTRRFIDAADAVIWLTPSSSPGQVDELDELKEELGKNKPLLPVITASDILEEDEEDGELVNFYVNKASDVRNEQEQDVKSRALQKLQDVGSGSELKEPISISIFMHRKQDDSPQGFINAGLKRLTSEMAALIDKGASYKTTKARQQVLNYLDKKVLVSLKEELRPKVEEFSGTVENNRKEAKKEVNNTIVTIQSDLSVLIPKWANEHKNDSNSKKIVQKINDEVANIINRELAKIIQDFSDEVKTVYQKYAIDGVAEFKEITIDYEQVKGSGAAAAVGAGGAAAGGAIGAWVGSAVPGVGTVIGGLLGSTIGGFLGSKAGKTFIETEMVTSVIGVDTAAFVKDVLEQVEKQSKELVPLCFKPWFEAIELMDGNLKKVRIEIDKFEKRIEEIKSRGT